MHETLQKVKFTRRQLCVPVRTSRGCNAAADNVQLPLWAARNPHVMIAFVLVRKCILEAHPRCGWQTITALRIAVRLRTSRSKQRSRKCGPAAAQHHGQQQAVPPAWRAVQVTHHLVHPLQPCRCVTVLLAAARLGRLQDRAWGVPMLARGGECSRRRVTRHQSNTNWQIDSSSWVLELFDTRFTCICVCTCVSR